MSDKQELFRKLHIGVEHYIDKATKIFNDSYVDTVQELIWEIAGGRKAESENRADFDLLVEDLMTEYDRAYTPALFHWRELAYPRVQRFSTLISRRTNDNEDLKYGYEFLDWEIIRVTDGTDNDLFGGLYCTRGRGRKIITTTVMGE